MPRTDPLRAPRTLLGDPCLHLALLVGALIWLGAAVLPSGEMPEVTTPGESHCQRCTLYMGPTWEDPPPPPFRDILSETRSN